MTLSRVHEKTRAATNTFDSLHKKYCDCDAFYDSFIPPKVADLEGGKSTRKSKWEEPRTTSSWNSNAWVRFAYVALPKGSMRLETKHQALHDHFLCHRFGP